MPKPTIKGRKHKAARGAVDHALETVKHVLKLKPKDGVVTEGPRRKGGRSLNDALLVVSKRGKESVIVVEARRKRPCNPIEDAGDYDLARALDRMNARPGYWESLTPEQRNDFRDTPEVMGSGKDRKGVSR